MSDGEGWGGGLPASSKRPVEGDDDSDEPAHKVPKTTAQTTSWFNSSFSVLDQRTSAKVAPVPQAARSARWISPAFSREATPAFVPPVPSTSRSAGGTSTSAAVRPAVASTSTPSRPLQPASQLGRQISLPPSTPTHPTAQRRTGPPAFSLPGKQTRSNERIHNPFATLKQLVPPSAGKTVRSPVTARFGIAGSQQKAPPRPAFAVKSDGSDPTSVDELERGLLPSPIKKGRANPKCVHS
ncbi:hypothetical protein CALVIDRAFT_339347 [Calocera viscosa TUFC12733]|uniref:Uncharacterized protein n=1 Tax=Calocera viscosa (strain TUFC12733) TaxID=1330018 RepID=A0A167HH45_CALVF|nr:hypothetical protein CALVIDRAFT_339347 [Calocera viscosa TUFC12733]